MAVGVNKAALLAFGLGALATPALADDTGNTVKIGVVAAESGSFVSAGHTLPAGVSLAVKEINDAGGVKVGDKTYKLKLVMLDDTYSATGGRTAADRLIKLEKVSFIIGPVGSPAALGALSATDPGKTPPPGKGR